MELSVQTNGDLRNGHSEIVDIEEDLLYPMLKSSDLANGNVVDTRKMMLVPQQSIGADTACIESLYPRTWKYLTAHGNKLDERRSAIYRNRPRFSVFGVGDYSFSPWKIAISGLYKHLRFRLVGPRLGKPVVLDDTCYFLSCESEEEGRELLEVLKSDLAAEMLEAHIFWDSKRPVTGDVLGVLDIPAIAREIGAYDRLRVACPRLSFETQEELF